MSSRTTKWRFRKRADGVHLTGEDRDSSPSSEEDDPAPPATKKQRNNDGALLHQGEVHGEQGPLAEAEQEQENALQEAEEGIPNQEAEHAGAAVNDENDPVALPAEAQEVVRHDVEQGINLINDQLAVGAEENLGNAGENENIFLAQGIVQEEGLTSESEEASSEESEEDSASEEGETDEDQNEEDQNNGAEENPEAFPNIPENENNQADEPLYPNAHLTLGQSVIAIMTFALAHKLTGAGLVDLLTLIALHCPPNNICARSLYNFHKHFKGVGGKILKCHYYCNGCYKLVNGKNDACPQCQENHGNSFFIEVPLLRQLQIMFKRPGFLNDLQFRFTRIKKCETNVEDIFDSEIYKQKFNSGFLQNPHNISFMWYSDGISLFSSKFFSIWPIYLVINELKYKQRVKKENIILVGIWFGKKKPKVNTFLSPFHSEFKKLYKEGYLLEVPDGPPIRVKGCVICGTCDMPAKALFLRITQFNGNFGCPRCLQKGSSYDGNPLIHVYPFRHNVETRCNAQVENFARVAVASGHPCYGIKGLSTLYRIVPNMIRSTGIDVMHGVFSGTAKLLLELWFDREHGGREYSIRHKVDSVNGRLKRITVPTFLNKFTKSVDNLVPWKSLDYKVWLMYYSIPVLLGLMPAIYIEHHMLLVSGIFLLSQRSISPGQIDRAAALLEQYVFEFQNLYDLRYMGINTHQLLHLADVVRDLGPTWVYACYFLEDLNGKVCRYIHGTSHVGKQVASTTTILQQLSSLVNVLDAQSPVRMFCDKLLKEGRKYKVAENIADGIFVVGKYNPLQNPPWDLLHENINIVGGHCQLFARLWFKGVLYLSESYTRATTRRASFVVFTSDNEACLGSIRYFIRWSDCNCAVPCLCEPCQYLCIIHKFDRIPWEVHDHPDNVSLAFINAVQPSDTDIIVPVSSLQCPCFYISMPENRQYIVQRVNELEAE